MKKYFGVVLLLALNILVLGILAPYLISEPSTESVLLGIVAVIALPPLNWALWKALFKTNKQTKRKKK